MTCYSPIKAYRTSNGVAFSALRRYDIVGDISLPCGMCIGCRMKRASDWQLRVMHEASLHADNCFVTLTYARDKLPAHGSLEHRDYQLFMKRLRKRTGVPVRFFMCGEYGPLTMRAHYHACLFGVAFREDRVMAGSSASGHKYYESALLSELWGLGRCTVQDLVSETASYCARYIMKKQLGPSSADAYKVVDGDGVIHQRRPPYACMSLKPGIGAGWLDKFVTDVLPRDYAVENGSKRPVPRYYFKRAKRMAVDTDLVEFERLQRAAAHVEDQTQERLSVRRRVHEARIRNLSRSDCDDASK